MRVDTVSEPRDEHLSVRTGNQPSHTADHVGVNCSDEEMFTKWRKSSSGVGGARGEPRRAANFHKLDVSWRKRRQKTERRETAEMENQQNRKSQCQLQGETSTKENNVSKERSWTDDEEHGS